MFPTFQLIRHELQLLRHPWGCFSLVAILFIYCGDYHIKVCPLKNAHLGQKTQLELVINHWTLPFSQIVRAHLHLLPENNRKVFK